MTRDTASPSGPDGLSGPAELTELTELAGRLRAHPGLRGKAQIGLVTEVLGGGSWVHGPGDDGAVVTMDVDPPGGRPGTSAEVRRTSDHVIACGEALLPEFVAADPYGAGVAAVLANVNDLAAMGAEPTAVVDTVVATADVAREILRGLKAGCALYDVPLVGGHLTVHDGPPSLSAFGVGRAEAVLSSTHVAVGQSLVVAGCTSGTMRADFPFFRSFDERENLLAGDVRLLSELARTGVCVAAKDVSMAGLVGSLAMLLEWSRLGVTLDLDALPRPAGVPLGDWLTCFPALVFLLCVPSGREAECVSAFHDRGLAAAVVGEVDDSGVVALSRGSSRAPVLDLTAEGVTGLAT